MNRKEKRVWTVAQERGEGRGADDASCKKGERHAHIVLPSSVTHHILCVLLRV